MHYLRYGAAMGRNPGKGFDTQFYLTTYPDAAESGLNPLLHYVLHGRDRGYTTRKRQDDVRSWIGVIRNKLLSLGFTDKPLEELREILDINPDPVARMLAARELALWHMREKTEEGYRATLGYLAQARAQSPALDVRSKFATIELLCHYFLGDTAAGLAAYDRIALVGEVTPDALLARVNFETTAEGRIAWINQVLRHYGISPVALLPDEGQPFYDRLTSASPLPEVPDGPKVTVLIAAYEAGDMLPTALRSLQEQTWKNLEILVLDDCSPTPETCEVAERFAATDPRIRLIRMEENGGAYVARNRGLDEATGEFVTLHDADDWSHPMKIETQVRFLEANASVMGCTSEQARCQGDLSFGKLRGGGGFIVFNTSSFLWRRKQVHEAIGYWDSVRFGADNEFIRRMQVVFGKASFQKLPTGPLSFQREAESSITTDPIKGIDSGGHYYGVRREYHDAQLHHHKTATSLKYGKDRNNRAFPVPPMMLLAGSAGYQHSFDVVICDDLRQGSPAAAAICTDVEAMVSEGKRVALAELYAYDYNAPTQAIDLAIRNLIARGLARILVYGDVADAGDIRYPHGTPPDTTSRFMPTLTKVDLSAQSKHSQATASD